MFEWFKNAINGLKTRAIGEKGSIEAEIGMAPESWTGVQINDSTALMYSALFACVRVIAESVAGLPLITYHRDSDGSKRRASGHLTNLFHDQPNPEMSAFSFFETGLGHLCMRGNWYCEIERDSIGRVQYLWPLHPDRTWPFRKPNGELVYKVSTDNGEVELPQRDVLHVPGLSFDGLCGYSVIQHAAKQALGIAVAAEKFGASFFKKGARPSGYLKYPGQLNEKQESNVKEGLIKAYSGKDAVGGMPILQNGLEWVQLGIRPDEAQYLETRKFQVEEICRIYRVPPHMVGHLEKATFSNITQQQLSFYVDTLRPWLKRIEQEFNRKIFFGRPFYVEFLADAMLRGDTKSRFAAYKIAREGGWMSVNEIRSRENMNLLGPEGDTYLQPLNHNLLGENPQPKESEPKPKQDDDNKEDEDRGISLNLNDVFRERFLADCHRASEVQLTRVERSRERHLNKGNDQEKFQNEVGKSEENARDLLKGILEVTIRSILTATSGKKENASGFAETIARNQAQKITRSINDPESHSWDAHQFASQEFESLIEIVQGVPV